MIIPMKRVLVLCLAEHRRTAVAALGELGVLHVTPVNAPGGSEWEACQEQLTRAERALQLLRQVASERTAEASGATLSAEAPIDMTLALGEALQRQQELATSLRQELARVAPLGEFDPHLIAALEQQGYQVGLYSAPLRQSVEAPTGVLLRRLHQDGKRQWFALVAPAGALPAEVPYEKLAPPRESPADMRNRLQAAKQQAEQLREQLQALVGQVEQVAAQVAQLAEQRRFLEVQQGMGEAGPCTYLSGYCPEPRVADLRQAAAQQGWGLVINEPKVEEEPPTLIHYPALIRPIKVVFDFLQLVPGYREADISAVFLFFFSLFVGMLIGDAGYGALFLTLTLVAWARFRTAPAYPFVLFAVLSCSTIAWGALTGSYFGIQLEYMPAFLRNLKIQWLEDSQHVMALCFLIGAIHLTIAHLWNIALMLPQSKAWEQLGWLGMVWVMYFTAGAMVLGHAFPAWVPYLFGLSVLLIILFMTPLNRLREDWILHLMLPLNFVSSFVDLVSYVRLFAVGLASVKVAASFNNMVGGMFGYGLPGILGAVLILLLGHGLNIALCMMGVLVHGVRLNTLEFSMHKGMTWSGVTYQPYRRESTKALTAGELESRAAKISG